MLANNICAIVVTFRPQNDTLQNLHALRPQVQSLIVVDNGSPESSLEWLRAESYTLPFHLIENGANLGIAAALNIGVRHAIAQRARWVVLFDQDSTVTDGFISQMLVDFQSLQSRDNTMLLVPRYVDPKSGMERVFGLAYDGGPFVTITSGSFFPVEVFEKCGYFEEQLFIYTVDDEYSLRIRSKGFHIAQSRSAVLLHASGYPRYYYLFGKRIFTASNHSATARYYLNRNRIWMIRTYGRQFPRWTYEVFLCFIKELLKILVAEQSRCLKIKRIMEGIRDGIAGRMGRNPTL